jgi:hypothetical protein
MIGIAALNAPALNPPLAELEGRLSGESLSFPWPSQGKGPFRGRHLMDQGKVKGSKRIVQKR